MYATELPGNLQNQSFNADNAGNDSTMVTNIVAPDSTKQEIDNVNESNVKDVTSILMEDKNGSKATEDSYPSIKKKRFIIIGAAILTVTGIIIGIVAGIVNGRDDSEKKDTDMINDFPPSAPQILTTSP